MTYNGGAKNGGVDWKYYNNDIIDRINDKYLPNCGEGDTIATQIVTAVNKLIYKWYNDGDVFDNTYHLKGWCNDLSSYANWLAEYTKAARILIGISKCKTHADYENLLKNLADTMLDEEMLEQANTIEKIGSIYECDGIFKYIELENEDDDWEDEDDEY